MTSPELCWFDIGEPSLDPRALRMIGIGATPAGDLLVADHGHLWRWRAGAIEHVGLPTRRSGGAALPLQARWIHARGDQVVLASEDGRVAISDDAGGTFRELPRPIPRANAEGRGAVCAVDGVWALGQSRPGGRATQRELLRFDGRRWESVSALDHREIVVDAAGQVRLLAAYFVGDGLDAVPAVVAPSYELVTTLDRSPLRDDWRHWTDVVGLATVEDGGFVVRGLRSLWRVCGDEIAAAIDDARPLWHVASDAGRSVVAWQPGDRDPRRAQAADVRGSDDAGRTFGAVELPDGMRADVACFLPGGRLAVAGTCPHPDTGRIHGLVVVDPARRGGATGSGSRR